MRARLLFLCHGRTPEQGVPRFPTDEPLTEKAMVATMRVVARLPRADRVCISPAEAVRRTAERLGGKVEIETSLRDQCFGTWRGRTLQEVQRTEPEAFARWIADPAAAPHGGETIEDVVDRVGTWLDAERGSTCRTIVITHVAVVRAAVLHVLGAPAGAAGRFDVEPLTIAEFTSDGGRWRLRRLGRRLGVDE